MAVLASGHELAPEDIGNLFEKAEEVARHGDDRLEDAAGGARLPEPPRILADPLSLQFLLLATLGSQVLFVVMLCVASRERAAIVVRSLGLNAYRAGSIWRPAVAVVAAYLLVAIYAAIMTAVDIKSLEPESTVPSEVVRHSTTTVMAGLVAVVGAPLAEEFFFRGLIFGGFVRWGFWPAAAISSALFTLAHLDPGSMIPFFAIGVVIAWLFWSRGSLWDGIIFPFVFNVTSFALLVAGT
ncbi:MAG: CPBP family intramembrane glutamic endopeptidase [Tepidiformaceae bacterium]